MGLDLLFISLRIICIMLLLDLSVSGRLVVIEMGFLFFVWNLELGACDFLSPLPNWFDLMYLHYLLLLCVLFELRFTCLLSRTLLFQVRCKISSDWPYLQAFPPV